jgi:Zn-dependent protease with chaperone function
MNFFSRQDASRRLSRRLVFLFLLAVIAVVGAIDFVVFVVLSSMQPDTQGLVVPDQSWLSAHPGVLLITTLSVIGIIGLSSLYKTAVLSGGGGVVARSMGGVRVSPDTSDALQRRLLNVVEEMSIASGVPMPEVYLLEQESGINAFAAGHNTSNAAITVTRGTLNALNRAELQGVIAHEFSHILNGDMRMNIRLMGLLFGLLVIALIARTVLRFTPSRGDKKGGAAAIFIAAFAVLAIGYVGLFFGRLIQAAVSRSRESLADASAVQFTRDPSGLRNALVKIGALEGGSKIGNAEIEETAHMMFAPGIDRFFATHPPLLQRLKAIDPRFNEGEFAEMRNRLARSASLAESDEVSQASSAERLAGMLGAAVTPAAMASQLVGNPQTAHIDMAQTIRKSLPASLVLAARHPENARALLLALALDTEAQARDRQLQFLAHQLGAPVVDAIMPLLPDVDALLAQQRLPVLSSAFPALRQLTREQRTQLISTLNGMLQREGRLSLRSYTLRQLARVQLRDDLDPAARSGRLTIDRVTADLQVLFSVLAQHGNADLTAARRAYEAGMHRILPRARPAFTSTDNWPQQLDVALNRLDQLVPMAKEQLIEGLLETVNHDQQLTIAEAELLRVICASLHCPLPPLLHAA